MKTYISKKSYYAENNTILDTINISEFVDVNKYNLKKAWINPGGYQSWNPGYEIEPVKKQDSLTCHLIKGWNRYLVFPETGFKSSRNVVLGQFVSYLRWDNLYLVFASINDTVTPLPPVQFIYKRKENTVSIEIYDKGKNWEENEIQANICVFTAGSYFECKNKLKELFNKKQFESIEKLGNYPAGWESWYNHYADINENLILSNLKALTDSENIISKGSYSEKIFQIDDGWEQALGQWQIDSERFPNGLNSISQKIEQNGYIPGLWIAPFIIDARCKTAVEHPDWILKDYEGNKIISGFNPLWGEKGNFYCLDLSNDEVLKHLDKTIDRVINEWGIRYIKLDFLYAGMFHGDFKNKQPAYINYDNAIKILTGRKINLKGQPVYYLGCGVPFESSYNYLPLSRIGCDTLEHWENKKLRMINWNGRNEAYLNIKDTLGHSLWNRTIFANDPDVIFLREKNCSLTQDEKKLIALVDIFFGSQLMYSDDPCEKSNENELKLTNEILTFIEKYKNEEWGLKQKSKDLYEIYNKTETIKAELNIGKKHYIKFI